MGLIKIIAQVTNPETAGVPELITSGALKVSSGVVTIGSKSLTYTSTAHSIPSDSSLFESFEPAVSAMYGASGPAINGPIILDSEGARIYPVIA